MTPTPLLLGAIGAALLAPWMQLPQGAPVSGYGGPAAPASRRAIPDSIARRVEAIDRALVANDLKAAVACLLPEHTPARDLIERELETQLETSRVLSRRTEILQVVTIGSTDAAYVRVSSVLRPNAASKDAATAVAPFDRRRTDDLVLFFRPSPAGPALARLEDWSSSELGWLEASKITCPPCAWRVARPDGWFVVPRVAREGNSFDSFSLVHPDLQLSIDFDCFMAGNDAEPLELAERDQRALAHDLILAPSDFKPVASGVTTEEDVRRADLVVDLPGNDTSPALRFHRCYRRLGPFVFTFVIHGDAKTAERLSAETQSILNGLEILPAARDAEVLCKHVSDEHARGTRLEGRRFTNDLLGVTIDGPEGWKGSRITSVGRCRARFECLDSPRTTVDFFAREGDAELVYGESAVTRFVADRAVHMSKDDFRGLHSLRREVGVHPNRVDTAFEVESEWTAPDGEVMREWFVAIPSGRMIFCIVARAPKASFEAHREDFARSIASFARGIAR